MMIGGQTRLLRTLVADHIHELDLNQISPAASPGTARLPSPELRELVTISSTPRTLSPPSRPSSPSHRLSEPLRPTLNRHSLISHSPLSKYLSRRLPSCRLK